MTAARRIIIALGVAVAALPVGIAIVALITIATMPDDGRSSLSMVEHLTTMSHKEPESQLAD